MKTDTPRFATQAKKSVVVVFSSLGDYCSGFIAIKARVGSENSARTTLVVAPSRFVRGKEAWLNVSFFDGVQLPARVVAEEESFCLLETCHHPSCEEIKWLEDDSPSSYFVPGRGFVWSPSSISTMEYQPTYIVLESLESYLLQNFRGLVDDSKNYLMVSNAYNEKTMNGLSRMAAAPVFTLESGKAKDSGSAMGIVLQDCRPSVKKNGSPGTELSEMKVVITAAHFSEILKKLDPPPTLSLSVGRKQDSGGGQKRKRASGGGQKRKRAMT